ncbi:MAG: hypothetical protein ACREFY_18765 [Acetobacteraceae bacterium]
MAVFLTAAVLRAHAAPGPVVPWQATSGLVASGLLAPALAASAGRLIRAWRTVAAPPLHPPPD